VDATELETVIRHYPASRIATNLLPSGCAHRRRQLPLRVSCLLKIFAIVAVIVLVLLFVASLRVRSHLSADSLVADLEKSYNLRAQVGGFDTKIFANPSRIEISDLVLSPPDQVSKAGTPLSEREPIPDSAAIVKADKVELEVDLRDLIRLRLDFKKFLFHGLSANMTINEKGDSDLAKLLEKPRTKTKSDALEVEVVAIEEDAPEKSAKKKRLPIPASMERAAIASGTLIINNLKQGSRTTLHDLHIELTDIEVDASDLVARNHCDLVMDTRLEMANLETGEPYLDFVIHAEGEATPLNPSTGKLDPSFLTNVTLAQGSSIGGLPFLQMLSGSLDALAKIGLSLGDLSLRGELIETATSEISYEKSRIHFNQPLDLRFDRYAIGLRNGSWLNTDSMEHEFLGGISASDELTAEARSGVESFLQKKGAGILGEDAITDVADAVLEPLLSAAGGLTIEFTSSGDIAKPSVGVVTPLADVGDLIGTVGGKLLEKGGLLDGLLNGSDDDDGKPRLKEGEGFKKLLEKLR